MRGARFLGSSPALGAAGPLARLDKSPHFVHSLVRTPAFWHVHLMVAIVTIMHYVPDAIEVGTLAEDVCKYAVILYTLPIIYASLRLPPRGGLLTALWCIVVSTPDVVVDVTRDSAVDHLIPELTQLGTAVVVALVITRLVSEEGTARRRAEEMAAQLVRLNQSVIRECIRAQEEERGRIARELHDCTAQSIVLLFQRLDRVESTRGLPKPALSEVAELKSIAGAALDSVRQMSRDLRPSVLDELGLVAGVEWLGREIQRRRGVKVSVEKRGDQRRFVPEAELAAFRIAQEALTNVEKHSGAAAVVVRLDFEATRICLSVQDDGRGFELPSLPGGLATSGKLGLIGMRERAELAGGSLEIRSAAGEGTVVTAEFPYWS